jgi:hypothetical protein
MLAVAIIVILVLVLAKVSFERRVAEGTVQDLTIELRGRDLAAQEGRPFDPEQPCGQPSCDFPLCELGDDPRFGCYLSGYDPTLG